MPAELTSRAHPLPAELTPYRPSPPLPVEFNLDCVAAMPGMAERSSLGVVSSGWEKLWCLVGGDSHFPLIAGAVPVSYTHLDVYKRQVLVSRSRPIGGEMDMRPR